MYNCPSNSTDAKRMKRFSLDVSLTAFFSSSYNKQYIISINQVGVTDVFAKMAKKQNVYNSGAGTDYTWPS